MGIGDERAQIEVPAMPRIGASERLPTPWPLVDGAALTIGWQFGRLERSFVTIRRTASGRVKVVDRFPMTEGGWARAWHAFLTRRPDGAAEVVSALEQRAADMTLLPIPAAGILARFNSRPERNISRGGSVTTIASTGVDRATYITEATGGAAAAIIWLLTTHASVAVKAVGVACFAIAGLWGVCRAWSVAVRFDDQGVTISKLLRTYRLSWPAVSRFADGSVLEAGRRYWVLVVLSHDGRRLTVPATRRERFANREVLTVIREAATLHGIPAEVTGEAPAKRYL